ncbi:MAG: LTA synthase family protein, partial [Chitinophagales bacterium]
RGGWQQIPINESSAYFSKKQLLNDAAVNTVWNAGKKFMQDNKSLYTNPYRFLPKNEANDLVKTLFTVQKDSTISVLTTTRPNVVLFLLESFTADVVDALGGEKGVTPNLDSLIQHGLLFNTIYSQGFRTDQGLADVLSGFPAQPNFSIIMQPEKFKHLNFLPERMAANGYHTSFFYGGEAAFANMKAYLLAAGIEKITDKNSFSADEMNAKWGAHDGYVFQKQATDISSERVPFFSVILSLSSHEPFEVPMETKFPGEDAAAKFKNACAYTDQSIGEYFERVKKEEWYQNTLFIIVADHGHLQPYNRNPREPARFHIPLIFYGPVIRESFRGTKISNLGMQSDLPATLLAQLKIPYREFAWSNNLLNPFRNNFAYYTSDDAFGWMTDNGSMLYDSKNNTIQNHHLSETEMKSGKAYLQTLFDEYISY